jgi:tetratricopeptide (TPR) repeat protein
MLFNHVWDLMEKEGRTPEEDAEMIRDVQAMRFHWNEVGTARNKAVGEWQTARVYSLLKMPESAMYHAKRCLSLIKSGGEGLEDFHLPSAYEGLARAYLAAGKRREAEKYLASASRLAAKIKDPEDRKTVSEQIASVSALMNRAKTKARKKA